MPVNATLGEVMATKLALPILAPSTTRRQPADTRLTQTFLERNMIVAP